MNRADLEHIIAAAATISGDDEIVVIGSQAVLGSFPDAPPELLRSMEADVYPLNHPEKADYIHGAIGDGSDFHEMNGYFADGVGPETAKAPRGWQQRLVPVRVSRVGRSRQAVGWCLEIHDLVLSKCVARRERDWEWATATISHGLVDPETLWQRAQDIPLARADFDYVLAILATLLGRE